MLTQEESVIDISEEELQVSSKILKEDSLKKKRHDRRKQKEMLRQISIEDIYDSE